MVAMSNEYRKREQPAQETTNVIRKGVFLQFFLCSGYPASYLAGGLVSLAAAGLGGPAATSIRVADREACGAGT